MSYYFPNEILTIILKRLPVKALMRLRCVEKSWHSLIHSQDFITVHSNHPKNTSEDKFILLGDSFYKVLSIGFNKKEERERYRLPCMLSNITWHTVSNGLVCLSTISLTLKYDSLFNYNGNIHVRNPAIHKFECYYTGDIHLWNPAIHKYITVPDSPPRPGICSMILSFGFVAKHNDYKIVKLFHDSDHVFVDVYTLSSNSWKIITPNKLYRSIIMCGDYKEVFINGAAYWMEVTAERRNIILCFNTENDVMLERSLPLPINSEPYIELSLGSFDDQLLALFVMKQGFTIDMWVSEELGNEKYHEVSWMTKRFTIDGGCFNFQVLGLIGNDCVILQNLSDEFELDLYNLQNRHTPDFVSANLRCILGFYKSWMVSLIPFAESLVLLNSVIDSNTDLQNLKVIGV